MKDMLLEGAMTVVFIVTSWYIGGWVGVVLYACAYLGYVAVKEKILRTLVKYLRIGKYHGQNRF